MKKEALSQSPFYTIIVPMKLNFRTLKAKIARSIEAHRTDAVEAISLRNQGIASNTVPHFHISNFMAKASCFCLFFLPLFHQPLSFSKRDSKRFILLFN